MTIKINGTTIDSEVLPINKPSLDETLETFSFALKSTDNVEPYAPMQDVEITTDSNEKIYLVIVSDSVEPFSLNPVIYKHNITCIENTRKLSKHIVRNSVFSQPARTEKKGFFNLSSCVGARTTDSEEELPNIFIDHILYRNPYTGDRPSNPNTEEFYNSKTLTFESKEKVSNLFIRYRIHAVKALKNQFYEGEFLENVKSLADLNFMTDGYIRKGDNSQIIIKYKDRNNTLHSYNATSTFKTTGVAFDTLIPLDELLEEIKANGGNNLYIDGDSLGGDIYDDIVGGEPFTQQQHTFLVGVQYPTEEDYLMFFSLSIELIANTYYNTCYDILDLLINRQRQTYSTTNHNYSKTALFQLPVSGKLYDLLKNTIAPNFTFTQLTMYECVAEVFRLFDGIFTMNSAGVLGITYFNQANKNTIQKDYSGMTISLSEDKYTNGLLTYYQDARTKESFPNNDNFVPLRSSQLGVPEQSDHSFIVPHNIQYLDEVYALITKAKITSNYPDFTWNSIPVEGRCILDVSIYVLEEGIWTLLSPTANINTKDPQELNQNNTIYYAQGDNKIQCAYSYKQSWGTTKFAFGNMLNSAWWLANGWSPDGASVNVEKPSEADWKDIFMKVVYTTSVDGLEKVHSIIDKTDGETLIDQSNGAVDLNKLGLNMLGLSFKLGEPTLNATQSITTWSNRIKIGDVITYKDARWIANVVSYTMLGNGYIQTKVAFVKNFNALALRTRLWREKRISNISKELTTKSEDVITNFIYFTSEVFEQTFRQEIPFVEEYLAQCLYLSFAKDDSITLSLDYAVIGPSTKRIYAPLIVYGAGNTINFETSFDHPMSAGYQTTHSTEQAWWGEKKYFTSSVDYTDKYGFVDRLSFFLFANSNIDFSDKFPDVLDSLIEANPTSVIRLNNFYVYKQPNEIFALNYQLAFLGLEHDKDFVGNAFINDNFFVRGKQQEKTLYLYYSSTELYDILDMKGKGNSLLVSSTSYVLHEDSQTPGTNYIEVIFNTIETLSGVSWSICDKDGNILFAFNRSFTSKNSFSINYMARTNRK